MQLHSLIFRLSAATAIAGLVLAEVMPPAALAQPVPAGLAAMPGQQSVDPPERAGRVAQITGTVSFHAPDAEEWSPVGMNYPVATGDAFWTEPAAMARLEISASRIVLAGGTEFDVATLDPNGLQGTLAQGEAYLRLRNLAPGEAWSMQTPRGTISFSGAGRYAVVAGDTETPTRVTVLEGAAQVSGPGMALQVGPGQTATISGTDSFAGAIGPAQVDAFLGEMQREAAPPQHPAPAVVAQMPGGEDLAAYGSWTEAPEYGQVWYPRVAAGWVPYREGHWAYLEPWGWTWVDDAPWGFAPFHYGRWVEIGGRWAWTPGMVQVAAPPVYAPALVAFIGLGVGVGIGAALAAGSVGWCPLGPREAYHPWFHSSPRYVQAVNRHEVTNITVINNRNVTINNYVNRRAATVVPATVMAASRPVRPVARQLDAHALATARPVLGTAPIRPTAATAGVTPRMAHTMNLAPAPAGVAATPRVAPGPAIRAGVRAPGMAAPGMATPGMGAGMAAPGMAARGEPSARPPLHNAAERPGAVPGGHPGAAPAEHAGTPPLAVTPRAGEAPMRGGPGAAPAAASPHPATPELRTPGAREAGPPPIMHAAPVRPGEAHGQPGDTRGALPAGALRPGAVAQPFGSAAPGQPQIVHPGGAAAPTGMPHSGPERAARPDGTAPLRFPAGSPTGAPPGSTEMHAAPAPHAVMPEAHAPVPQPRAAPPVRTPMPEVRRPDAPAAPPPAHVSPPPQVHAPEVHAPPPPQVHAPPPPQVHAPEVHAPPQVQVHAPEVHAPPPQVHAPEVHAPPPQGHAPQVHAPAHDEHKPGEH